ncbi:putative C-3 sterol dehydrogenase [Lyophyllum shimeji]|uniref:C-3 sterol dehydrogenase n=1 Tax=Lyophyllum shimeji TaxID=47721 RepID=A0A9P3ULA4_LYOSH|nr:putative C-3 sterol dehydrogenase [Lyophyllum shimeji]
MPGRDVYLVLGGNGFIGRHIVECLLERKDQVSVFDIVQSYHDVPYYLGDIRDQQQVADVLEKVVRQTKASCIIHAVSPLSTKHLDNPRIYYSVNVEGTKAVIAAAIAGRVRKLVYTSTAGVVFNGRDIVNGDETLPYPSKHLDAYTESKALAEQRVLAANGNGGLMTVSIRPAGVFGPGDRETITGAYHAFERGLTHIQLGNNTNLFDRTYVGNVAYAHILAADKLDDPEISTHLAGEAFIINDGDPVPFWNHMRDIWAIFYEVLPSRKEPRRTIIIPRTFALLLAYVVVFVSRIFRRTETTFTPHSVTFATTTMYFSNDKARRVLGYEPKISVDEGLRRTAMWFKSTVGNGHKSA